MGGDRVPLSRFVGLCAASSGRGQRFRLQRGQRIAGESSDGIFRGAGDVDCFTDGKAAAERLRHSSKRDFWIAILGRRLWGFAMLSAILLVLRVTGHFQIDSVALAGRALLRYAVGWGAVFLAVAVHEEFAFRGYWLFAFARFRGFWRAALFTSLIFGAAHLFNSGENVLGILQVVAIGLVFCLMIRRTGTLWFALGFHAAWDWAETFFYGTPDSGLLGVGRYLNTSVQGPKWLTGGSAGPEGSVVAFLVIMLCALLVHLRFPKAVYPDHPA